jgi:hypothetical protein
MQADGNVAGIETVGPIATVASSDGERWPDLPMGVAVMPRGTVLNGDFPLVYIPAVRTVDAIDVRVRELSSPRPDTSVVDEGSAQRGWFTVGARLKTAAEYAVDVRRGSGEWASVGSFNVSSNPASAGRATSVGSVSVSGATGQASWAWTSPTLAGPAGGVGLGLAWSSGAKASPGMPEGWRLSVSSSSPWMALEESGPVRQVGSIAGQEGPGGQSPGGGGAGHPRTGGRGCHPSGRRPRRDCQRAAHRGDIRC